MPKTLRRRGCLSLQIGIVVGYPEKVEESTLTYNSAILIGKSGELLINYRKSHCWSSYERRFFTPGDELSPVVPFEGIKVALLICYDVEFPELCRALALQGCNLFLVPTGSSLLPS
jgi:predicted amidohydrolase